MRKPESKHRATYYAGRWMSGNEYEALRAEEKKKRPKKRYVIKSPSPEKKRIPEIESELPPNIRIEIAKETKRKVPMISKFIPSSNKNNSPRVKQMQFEFERAPELSEARQRGMRRLAELRVRKAAGQAQVAIREGKPGTFARKFLAARGGHLTVKGDRNNRIARDIDSVSREINPSQEDLIDFYTGYFDSDRARQANARTRAQNSPWLAFIRRNRGRFQGIYPPNSTAQQRGRILGGVMRQLSAEYRVGRPGRRAGEMA